MTMGITPTAALHAQSHNSFFQGQGFIENKGQIHTQEYSPNKAVRFLWSGQGMNVQLRNDGISYDTYARSANGTNHWDLHRMDVRFINAKAKPNVYGEIPTEYHVNCYNPERPNLSAVGIQTFQKVVYENIYENIDLWVSLEEGDHTNFKYDFVAGPGADLSAIQIEYTGFDQAEVYADAIHFQLSGRQLTESIPLSYTLPGNETTAVTYQTISKSSNKLIIGYAAQATAYAGKTLVIDPLTDLAWSTYYGDSLSDVGYAITTDSLGNVFAAGATESLQFMASAGAYQNTYAGGDLDAYVVRFNAHGLRQWATYYGGSGTDKALGMDMIHNDYFYVVGSTTSTDSIGSDGAAQPENAGGQDGFVAKFNRDGGLIWDTFIGGTADDELNGCHAISNGDVWVAGTTGSNDLSLFGVPFLQGPSGGTDALIIRLSAAGAPTWATYFGGPENETCAGIVENEFGNFIIAGTTNSTTGIASGEGLQLEIAGTTDGFIAQFTPEGTVQWGTYYGGPTSDEITGISTALGFIFVCGHSDGENPLTDTLSYQAEFAGIEDAFVAKINTESATEWYTFYGGEGSDRARSVTNDLDGHVYITGSTQSTTQIEPDDSTGTTYNGLTDAFIAKFTIDGMLEWGRYHGGAADDDANALVVYGYTAVYTTGSTNSADSALASVSAESNMVHQGIFGGGGSDAFVTRITQTKATVPPNICACPGEDGGGGSGGGGSGGGGGGGGGGGNYNYDLGICLGDSITIYIQGGCLGIGGQWVWYADACGETDAYVGEGTSITVSPQQTTTYYVRGESVWDITLCANKIVYVDTIVPAIVSNPLMTACENGVAFLSSPPVPNLSYFWYNNTDSLVGTFAFSAVDSLQLFHNGIWSLEVSTTFGCRDTAYFEMIVNPGPNFQLELNDPTCEGRTDGSIAVIPAEGEDLYAYLQGGATTPSLLYSDLGAGMYNLNIVNEFSCHAYESVFLFEPPNPVDSSLVHNAWCDNADGSIELFFTGNAAPYEVSWNDSTYFGSPLDSIPGGEYTAEILDVNDCPFPFATFVDNQGFFTAIIAEDSLEIDQGESVELLVTTSPPVPQQLFYNWQPAELVACSDCNSTEATPYTSTQFVVMVESEKGCTSSDTVFVYVIVPPSRPFMPTIFSPNNDGLNDQLCVLGDRIVTLQLEIFNRWGEKVFSANAPGVCWDGNYDGKPVNTGTLVYSLLVSLDDGEVVNESGNLSIVR